MASPEAADSKAASKKRGRKQDDSLPPSRSRDIQRAFRARRAALLSNLEARAAFLEAENAALRAHCGLPPDGPPLSGPEPQLTTVETATGELETPGGPGTLSLPGGSPSGAGGSSTPTTTTGATVGGDGPPPRKRTASAHALPADDDAAGSSSRPSWAPGSRDRSLPREWTGAGVMDPQVGAAAEALLSGLSHPTPPLPTAPSSGVPIVRSDHPQDPDVAAGYSADYRMQGLLRQQQPPSSAAPVPPPLMSLPSITAGLAYGFADGPTQGQTDPRTAWQATGPAPAPLFSSVPIPSHPYSQPPPPVHSYPGQGPPQSQPQAPYPGLPSPLRPASAWTMPSPFPMPSPGLQAGLSAPPAYPLLPHYAPHPSEPTQRTPIPATTPASSSAPSSSGTHSASAASDPSRQSTPYTPIQTLLHTLQAQPLPVPHSTAAHVPHVRRPSTLGSPSTDGLRSTEVEPEPDREQREHGRAQHGAEGVVSAEAVSKAGVAYNDPEDALVAQQRAFLRSACGTSPPLLPSTKLRRRHDQASRQRKWDAFCTVIAEGVLRAEAKGRVVALPSPGIGGPGERGTRGDDPDGMDIEKVKRREETVEGDKAETRMAEGCCEGKVQCVMPVSSERDQPAPTPIPSTTVTAALPDAAQAEECCGGLIDCSGPLFDDTPSYPSEPVANPSGQCRPRSPPQDAVARTPSTYMPLSEAFARLELYMTDPGPASPVSSSSASASPPSPGPAESSVSGLPPSRLARMLWDSYPTEVSSASLDLPLDEEVDEFPHFAIARGGVDLDASENDQDKARAKSPGERAAQLHVWRWCIDMCAKMLAARDLVVRGVCSEEEGKERFFGHLEAALSGGGGEKASPRSSRPGDDEDVQEKGGCGGGEWCAAQGPAGVGTTCAA